MRVSEEQNKTKEVLLNIIAFMKDSLNKGPDYYVKDQKGPTNSKSGLEEDKNSVKSTGSTRLKTKINLSKDEVASVEDEKALVVEEKASTIGEDVMAQDDSDIMSFLNISLINPMVRRRLIAERKLPKPSPKKDALSSLPKYSGPNEHRRTEETQRITLSWLNSVEGVIIS